VKPKNCQIELYTDEELCEKVVNQNCSESLTALYERHAKLFTSVSSKIIGFAHANHDEFVSNKFNILFETIKSFNPLMKVKFSTWLANQIRYFCLNLNKRTNKMVLTEDSTLEFLINSESSRFKKSENELSFKVKDVLNGIQNKKIKDVIYYRYFYKDGEILNYNEIGKILNVTAQTALNWHNKFVQIAKKKLTRTKNHNI
jgi:RNA polymerase sigma factor (sigma-70 family)